MKKLIAILFLTPLAIFGQIPKPTPNTYVNDYAGKLTTDQIQSLNEMISTVEKTSSVQIAIVILKQLPENMSIEDYAIETGRKWHVGNARNGLVYVISTKERKQRLEVAQALQSKITDLEANRLIQSIRPQLKADTYYEAMLSLLTQISEEIKPIAHMQLGLAKEEKAKKEENESWPVWIPILFIIGAGVSLLFIWLRLKKSAIPAKKDEPISPNHSASIPTLAGISAQQLRAKYKYRNPPPGYQSQHEAQIEMLQALAEQRQRLALLNKEKEPERKRRIDDEPAKRNETPDVPYVPYTPSYTPPPSAPPSDYGNYGRNSSGSDATSGFDGGGATGDF